MGDDMNNLINKAKMILKSILKTILKVVLPIAIIIILLGSFVYFITIDDGTYKEDDWSSTSYGASQYTNNVKISSDGKITTPMTAQEVWDKMVKEGSRVDLYLNDSKQLLKLMNAETITQFLDTRSNPDDPIDWDKINDDPEDNSIQGIIKLKRKLTDESIITMTYVDPDTFQSYIDTYNSTGSNSAKNNALKHFTIEGTTETVTSESGETTTTTDYYAKVASWSETNEKVESTDPEQKTYTSSIYSMGTTNINYQDLVRGYTMPFDYLWQLLVIGEDKDFVSDLADLVYNSKIEITVHDNLTTNTNVDDYTYTKKKRTDSTASISMNYIDLNNVTKNAHKNGTWTDEEKKDYKTTHTTVTKTNTLEISVTLADVWMAKYEQDYTREIPDDIVTTSEETLDDIPYPTDAEETTKSDVYGHLNNLRSQLYSEISDISSIVSTSGTIIGKIYHSTVNRKETVTNTTTSTKYVSSPMRVEEKTDKNSTEPNFVTIFLDYENSKARNNILSVESWLFELIEENEKTVNLLDLTKYLLYKATDHDYGVTDYEYNSLYTSNLSTVGMGSDYVVHIDKSPESIVITDINTLKKAFSGYAGSSKLIENAEYFLQFQEKYRVNAVFAAAVSISETSAGRAGHAIDGKNNWFNIECHCGNSSHGRFETYGSASESIEKFYNLIENGTYYFKQDKYTVTDIGMTYCENADQPGGWIEVTNAYMTKMFNAAGIETTSFGVEGGITTEEERIALQNHIENDLIHTKYHYQNYMYQNGPFAKWWSSPYNILNKFQCTWWAYGRASQYLESKGGKYTKYPRKPNGTSGNGGEWYDINKQYGWFKYGSAPRPNSIVSWKKGTYGHVAYVEGVTADGKVYISHAGGGKSWYGVQLIDPVHYGSFIFNGYIYLDEPN